MQGVPPRMRATIPNVYRLRPPFVGTFRHDLEGPLRDMDVDVLNVVETIEE